MTRQHLSGAGSVIQSENSASQEVSIDSTLTTIGAAGTLSLRRPFD